jgi:hypothetical protein
MSRHKKIALILLEVAMCLIALLFSLFIKDGCFVDCDYRDPLEVTTVVTYECANKEILAVTYGYGKNRYLDLDLYDEKGVTSFPRLSEFESKYSILNGDSSVEFWSEDDEEMTTYLKENGVITHRCVFQSSGE